MPAGSRGDPAPRRSLSSGETIPNARWVDGQLIDAYAKAGEDAELANLIQDHLAEARKTLPKDSPQLAGLLVQIGMSLLQQKKWTEAEPLLRECLAIREKTQPDDWRTFNTKSMLGGVLLGQKKFAETEPLLLAGYEGMKQRENTIPPQVRTVSPKPSTASSTSSPPRTSRTTSRSGKPSGRSTRTWPRLHGRGSDPRRPPSREGLATRPSWLNAYIFP